MSFEEKMLNIVILTDEGEKMKKIILSRHYV